MEEEEIIIDPPKGAKPKATSIPAPIGAKKKGNTTAGLKSEEDSTQAGSGMSTVPGKEQPKPSGKSTEEDGFTRYFNAYSEKLGKQYSDKVNNRLKTDVDTYIQSIGGLQQPDLKDQKQVDEYNRKAKLVNVFQDKRYSEILGEEE